LRMVAKEVDLVAKTRPMGRERACPKNATGAALRQNQAMSEGSVPSASWPPFRDAGPGGPTLLAGRRPGLPRGGAHVRDEASDHPAASLSPALCTGAHRLPG